MTSKDESNVQEKLQGQMVEVDKIEKGLNDFRRKYNQKAEYYAESLANIVGELQAGNPDATLSPDSKLKICSVLSNVKSNFTEAMALHRGIHGTISKFRKAIERTFIEDTSDFIKYIDSDPSKSPTNDMNVSAPDTNIYKKVDTMNEDELLSAILVEELVRSGYGSVAVKLAKEAGLSEEDVGMGMFREVGSMVFALKNGDLEPAKAWLATHEASIGPVAKDLKYVLAKLEFLLDVQKCSGSPAAVIGCLSEISPYSKDYPEDFKHIMGSLLFMDRDLSSTPYADLSLTDQPGNIRQFTTASGVSLPILPMVSLFADEEGENKPAESMETSEMETMDESVEENLKPNAFVRAAHLFGAVACQHQLALSSIGPLRMAFASGLKVLPKLHKVQKAFSWLPSYTKAGSDGTQTLPVTVELDSVAQQHNIFHCPVMKEVSSWSVPPVRLHCGHAISREAYNSLANTERRKVKCPYCPKESTREQVMTLFF
ncbi:hypothetical protein Aperf_G00000076468 [Anoplocephala perfoliata]